MGDIISESWATSVGIRIPSGEIKKSDVRAASDLIGHALDVRKIQKKEAMLHGKALLWDHNDIVVTSFNWGSHTASEAKPLDEIGLHFQGLGIADLLYEILKTRILDLNKV